MKVLVTGGAGFIGSHVVDMMIAAGHDVVIVDDLSTGRRSNINPDATFYELDIRDPKLNEVFENEQPEVISHHAAQIDLRRSITDPVFDAEVNILGSISLLQLAHKFRVRKFIYISSGGAAYGEPDYLPCDENHPIRPLSPYGAAKYAIELYLFMYKENHGLDYSVLRYPNVYGPRQDPYGEAGVIAIFIGKMLKGESVTIYGNGEQVRDFVFVEDCARANVAALEAGSGGVYNLGMGIGTSINEIFTNLKEIISFPTEAIYAPPVPGETFRIYLDATLAENELGWKPTVDLREGMRRTVEYFQQKEA